MSRGKLLVPLVCLAVVGSCATVLAVDGVEAGASEEQVRKAQGEPLGLMARGRTVVWLYSWGTVTFRQGVVSSWRDRSSSKRTTRPPAPPAAPGEPAEPPPEPEPKPPAKPPAPSQSKWANVSGITSAQIESLQKQWSDKDSGASVLWWSAAGIRRVTAAQRTAYRRSGKVPFRFVCTLRKQQRLASGRTTRSLVKNLPAQIRVLDEDNRQVLNTAVSLAQLCPS
jgi:hypothetical protein